jgi:hypothetical protein
MATKKRAGKRTQIACPLCIQIEHSEGNSKHLKLSKTGNRWPNSVCWMLQNLHVPKNSSIELPLGCFQGFPGPPTTKFLLPIDATTAMTATLTLDTNAPPRFDWDHKVGLLARPKTGAKINISGGGIIVDA